MESVVDLQCGNSHLLALSVRGQIYVWGKNQMGQLGLSDSKSRMQPTLLESEHLHRNVIQILAFQDRSYALTKSGVIYAWGSNADGTLGVAEDMGANVLEPTPVIRLEGIQVSHLEVQGLSRPALRPVKLSH
jgi:regulator of chromosome condensation